MNSQERSRVCSSPGCLRKFKTVDAMLQHQVDSHGKKVGIHEPLLQRLQSEKRKPPPAAAVQPAPSMKQLACGVCGQKFKEHVDLFQHQQASPSHRTVLAQHNGSVSSCSECNAIFQDPKHLDQHFLAKHPVSRCETEEYNNIAIVFAQRWAHPGRRPIIVDIFRVHNPGHRVKRFVDYREKLRARNKGVENEVPRYHGTTVRCGLGVTSRSVCSNTSCNLCSIILSGFKKKKAEVSGFLRFGTGIYVTQTSSKANAYVRAYDNAAPDIRAMLVCKVLAGRSFEIKFDMPELLQPPPEYDSVSGVVGERLNYDELVVYEDAAILPEFVIVYKLQ